MSRIFTTNSAAVDRWLASGVGVRSRRGAPLAVIRGRSLPARWGI